MNKQKILIVGGGIGARRYVESLLWAPNYSIELCGVAVKHRTEVLASDFALPFITFNELTTYTLNQYSAIIFCLPPSVRCIYIQHIINLHFNGVIVIEKPLTIDQESLVLLNRLFERHRRIAVVCQRDFAISDYWLPLGINYHINFYSHTKDITYNIINQLPHILSWLLCCGHDIRTIKQSNDTFNIETNDSVIVVQFHSNSVNRETIVNEQKFTPPNYRVMNKKIIDEILTFSECDFNSNFGRATRVSSLLIGLLNVSR